MVRALRSFIVPHHLSSNVSSFLHDVQYRFCPYSLMEVGKHLGGQPKIGWFEGRNLPGRCSTLDHGGKRLHRTPSRHPSRDVAGIRHRHVTALSMMNDASGKVAQILLDTSFRSVAS